MALKINVGFTQKHGQPDYGSVGASCNIECELDSDLLVRDPAAFQQRVQHAYEACTQAVHDELARHQHSSTGNGHTADNHSNGNGQPPANGNGHAHGANNGAGNGTKNGNGARSGSGRLATQSQVRAIHAIANHQGLDLPALLRERFGLYRADELSLTDASRLIDELKSAPATGMAGGR